MRNADFQLALNKNLILAAFDGHIDEVRKLLGLGADVNYAKNEGRTPLLCAASKGHELIASLLLKAGADINHNSQFGDTALSLATYAKYSRLAALFLTTILSIENIDETSNNTLSNALIYAAVGGHDDFVDRLLEKGARPSYIRMDGFTALWAANHLGHKGIVRKLEAALAEPVKPFSHPTAKKIYALPPQLKLNYITEVALTTLISQDLINPKSQDEDSEIQQAICKLSEEERQLLKEKLMGLVKSDKLDDATMTTLHQHLQQKSEAIPFFRILKTSGSGKPNHNTQTWTDFKTAIKNKVKERAQQEKPASVANSPASTFGLSKIKAKLGLVNKTEERAGIIPGFASNSDNGQL